MARDEQQDINKIRYAGSDLPPRGAGLSSRDISKIRGNKDKDEAKNAPKEAPPGYRGRHERRD